MTLSPATQKVLEEIVSRWSDIALAIGDFLHASEPLAHCFAAGRPCNPEDLKRLEVCAIATCTTAGRLEGVVQALGQVVVVPPPEATAPHMPGIKVATA